MITDDLNSQSTPTTMINSKETMKKYQCEQCPKWFSRPSALQSHIYTHTGEKPYQCDISGCGRRFAVISNLRRHLRVHTHSHTRRRLSSQERRGYVQRLIERTESLNINTLDNNSFQNFCYLSNSPVPASTSLQRDTPLPYDNLRKLMPKSQTKSIYSSVKPVCLTVQHLLNDD